MCVFSDALVPTLAGWALFRMLYAPTQALQKPLGVFLIQPLLTTNIVFTFLRNNTIKERNCYAVTQSILFFTTVS